MGGGLTLSMVVVTKLFCATFYQAMAERSREISVHRDLLQAQIKACESERQTVRYVPGWLWRTMK